MTVTQVASRWAEEWSGTVSLQRSHTRQLVTLCGAWYESRQSESPHYTPRSMFMLTAHTNVHCLKDTHALASTLPTQGRSCNWECIPSGHFTLVA
ncbi:hypothetical protein E2C01_059539 [Portunus trituberculatus]|uniref:Uncharacterized protein n=1 Tax=Portunus trituberculatus TaxID=210409 RepID=A0A5B7H6Z6_PORTR|nr:hypothetical protein [Portunus trituberculatus]